MCGIFNFLIDTGAEVSVNTIRSPKPTVCEIVLAANGSKITTFGSRAVTIDLPQGKFKRTFVIANVAQPLLGDDFLSSHSLLVDMKHQHLVKAQFFTSISMKKAPDLKMPLRLFNTNG